MKIRAYRMTKRAESAEQTRLHITESAVALHGSLGPLQSSVSAIAVHAGVRRATVYRHFPDEAALFSACSAHWMAANPLPDLGAWGAIHDFSERLGTALHELYSYYRRTERMLTNVLRDEDAMPVVRQTLGGFRNYLTEARNILSKDEKRGRKSLAALLGHALSFPVWRSLAIEQRLSDDQCARLMSAFVRAGLTEMERRPNRRAPRESARSKRTESELVEAAGVEPASEIVVSQETPCSVRSEVSLPALRADKKRRKLVR